MSTALWIMAGIIVCGLGYVAYVKKVLSRYIYW